MSADQIGVKEKYLLVTTTGPTAEFQGSNFGLYREAGTHHGAPYYVQLHDVNTNKEPCKIYKDNNVLYGVAWKAGLNLGDAACGLLHSSNTDTVPETGWQYNDGTTWHHDAGIRVRHVEDISTLLCGTITISATGEAAKFQSKGMGKFRPTGQFSAGRQVFYNRRYLSVYPCRRAWGSRYNAEDSEIGVRSGCAPGLCPAFRRAAVNEKEKINSWQYHYAEIIRNRPYPDMQFSGWEDGDITVKCNVHNSSILQFATLQNVKNKTNMKS